MGSVNKRFQWSWIFIYLWIGILISVISWVMSLCPIWNGQIPEHRNQYEKMAESLLHGHLYLETEVSKELMELDNPYDPLQRVRSGAKAEMDHAYYRGHYYMYFGIVPVILIFLPYRIITGKALATYHATQLFTALIIIGFFCLFGLLRKTKFPKMNKFVYGALSTAFSLASIWFFADAPALYCTAISSAVSMMIWSFYFFLKSFYTENNKSKCLLFNLVGALAGALSFGCRPTVGLANIAVLPLLYLLYKKTTDSDRKSFFVSLLVPYILVGSLLMLYNYTRFNDPFEFGQAYQLTISDQHNYHFFSNFSLVKIYNGFVDMFFQTLKLNNLFPYIEFSGLFTEFPIFLFAIIIFLTSRAIRNDLQLNQMYNWIIYITISVLIITVLESVMSPFILERYHPDVSFLLSIASFIVLGMLYQESDSKRKRKLNVLLLLFSLITALSAVLLFFVPYDSNLTHYYPSLLENIRKFMPTFN